MPAFPKMTAATVRDVVARMRAETKKDARVFLMKAAIKQGHLSEAAKDVYREALKADGATT